jgi:hypothetical protein
MRSVSQVEINVENCTLDIWQKVLLKIKKNMI